MLKACSIFAVGMLFWTAACQTGQSSQNPPLTMENTTDTTTGSLADTFELADDVLIPYRKGDLFGYVNKQGEWVIEPQWPSASPFINGRAAVMTHLSDDQDAVAMIDRQGNRLTEYYYMNIAPSGHPGHWQVRLLGGSIFGKNQWGIIDSMGNEVIPAGFQQMVYQKELGWYLVQLEVEGPKGYIDPQGNVILSIEYDRVIYADNGFPYFLTKKDGKYQYLDKNFNPLFPEKYDEATIFFNGMARIKHINKHYLMDFKGGLVLDLKASGYDDIGFGYKHIGIVSAKSENPMDFSPTKLIDINSGKEIIPFNHNNIVNISQFIKGHAVVKIQKDREKTEKLVGIINEQGDFTVEPKYDKIYYYGKDRYMAKYPTKEMASELINAEGDVIHNSPYYITQLAPGIENFYTVKNFTQEPVLIGLIDYKGNEILPVQYEYVDNEGFDKNGLIQVKKDGKYYYVDMKGTEYISE